MKEIAEVCPLYSHYLPIFISVLGAIIGSFLTVCIYRIPLGREKGPPNFDELESEEGTEDLKGEGGAEQENNISICKRSR